ncbi:hypothetical protein [Leifsonia sp. P73]|uniref:hypothetical protein n=1 Tax=Leifsonia sp. P73 TaxID=3423959 RepID=UPI003DA5D375
MKPNEIRETREPDDESNWPDLQVEREPRDAHAGDRVKLAGIGVSITGDDQLECICVSLADYQHFLHSTTARALGDQLAAHDGHAIAITIHGVTQTAGVNASRALRQTLERRLTEWNKHARANGAAPV